MWLRAPSAEPGLEKEGRESLSPRPITAAGILLGEIVSGLGAHCAGNTAYKRILSSNKKDVLVISSGSQLSISIFSES